MIHMAFKGILTPNANSHFFMFLCPAEVINFSWEPSYCILGSGAKREGQ